MMEDKKRKKFGLSLKNAKKLAVSTSEIKLIKEKPSSKTPSCASSKEQKDVSVLDARRPSCMEEYGLERKLKPSVNTLREENLVAVDNKEEHERILWKNLFSINSSANWETMEDLPISVSEVRRQEDSNNTISSSLNLDFKTTQMTETFNIDLDYKDLPRPCITCYARKPCRLTWSQVDEDKRMEKNDIYHINPSPKDAASDMNTSSIEMNLKNNFGSISLFQKKTDSLKNGTNAKSVASNYQNMECKKKFHLQNNLNKNKKVKNNTEGCFKCGPSGSGLNHRTTETFIDLTSDKPEQMSVKKQKFGTSGDLTYSTKEQSFGKQNNIDVKNGTNAKSVASNYQNIECKKKFHLQNNLNKNKKVKNNTEGCFKCGPSGSGLNHRTTETFIDLTSDKPEQMSVKKQKFGTSGDLTYSTKEQSFGKQNNIDVFPKTPSGLINAESKVKSERPNSILGNNSGAKGNVAVVKKEILKCCPICQFQFPQRTNKQGIDEHISNCIGNEELFIDDDEEDW